MGSALYTTNNSVASGPGQKIMIASKLTGSLNNGPLASGAASSSILNLPVLGQENQLQPTNRNLKGIESTKHLFRNEESKIASSGAAGSMMQNPIYYSRSNNMNP